MKYDNDYLKQLYETQDLDTFLSSIDVQNIVDPRKRAIVGALKRSIQVLRLEFNPLPIKDFAKSETNQG
jgi:hypothetical protein